MKSCLFLVVLSGCWQSEVATPARVTAPKSAPRERLAVNTIFRLPCTFDYTGRKTEKIDDLVCIVDAARTLGPARLFHLTCNSPKSRHVRSFGPTWTATWLVRMHDGLWAVPEHRDRSGPAAPPYNQHTERSFEVADLEVLRREPPVHALPGSERKWQTIDVPPPDEQGTRHESFAAGAGWCTASEPWGTGGNSRRSTVCFDDDGALIGASYEVAPGNTLRTACGVAPRHHLVD